MKKIFITYKDQDKIKKAVLDENMYKQYLSNPMITEVVEYETETLLERRYAEKIGVSKPSKKQLLD